MYKLKYINQEAFGTAFGFFFSIPTTANIFLQFIALSFVNDTNNPTIPTIIGIISTLVFISSWIGIFDLISKYHRMRGVITDNHIKNLVMSIIFGSITGLIVQAIVF